MHHPTDRIIHTTAFVTPVEEHWLEREIICLGGLPRFLGVALFLFLEDMKSCFNILDLLKSSTFPWCFLSSLCLAQAWKSTHYITFVMLSFLLHLNNNDTLHSFINNPCYICIITNIQKSVLTLKKIRVFNFILSALFLLFKI